jgi:glutamyl/glutaminyl-tRNA synthetase
LVDIEKLNWTNSNIIKNMDTDKLYEIFKKYLENYDTELLSTISFFPEVYNKKVISELKTKIKKFDEFRENSFCFYNDTKIPSSELMINEKMKIDNIDIVVKSLSISLDILKSKNSDFNSIDEVKNIFVEKIQIAEMKNGQVLWPVRCALS